MLTIIFSVVGAIIGFAIVQMLFGWKIKKEKRAIELMHYFDAVGYDENNPKYNELGILLHGKREWEKRLKQMNEIKESFAIFEENIKNKPTGN